MAEAARPFSVADILDKRVVAGPIRRLTVDLIDPWLLRRLEKVWPGRTEAFWRGRFRGFMASNDYLALCNDRAVLLAERKPHPVTAVPAVDVLFCWSRDTEAGEWLEPAKAQPMLDLYMACRRWLTDMKGERMVCGLCDDLRSDTIINLWLNKRGGDGQPCVLVRPYKGRAAA